MDRVTIAEAADRLGVTRDAVRKRIKRGSIEWERDPGGETYVFVDASATDEDASATVGDTSGHALFDRMAGEIDYLRQQLEVWQEEARRKDHIIAALTDRIPELEAPRETREAPEAASEESEGGEDRGGEERRPWWRRVFGG